MTNMSLEAFGQDSSVSKDETPIPPGKIRCFITGKLRKDTPEERVRQDMARSLVDEYGYDKKDIGVEYEIKMGKAKKRVDLAVFLSKQEHTQENIFLIVEAKHEDVKASDKKEGIAQLESYLAACPNAKIGLWVGNERVSFKQRDERGVKVVDQIPDIPKSGQTTTPRPTKGSLVPAVNLKLVFRRIHNYIYANQGFQKDKAFEELLKIIFIKVYDEQYSPSLQFYLLPEEKIEDLRTRLENLFLKVQLRYKFIFKGNESIELNDNVLSYVVSELQRFNLVDTETDVKGEAYEELVGPNLRGDRGEFFTPRNVCTMTIDMAFSFFSEEELTSPAGMKIIDPATGTGGFLIAGVQKLRKLYMARGIKYDKLRDRVKEVAESNFYGIDFNPFLVKVSQMNMVMHGDGSANIVHANSLAPPERWNPEARSKIKLGDFDLVVTNPPFGTKALIDDQEILAQYQLTVTGSKADRVSLPPEQLFIERCLALLKPGGVLAIVLPDSIPSNPGLTWIREWLLDKAFLIASIDLPVETFEPYTGTQTTILILRKKRPNEREPDEGYRIFMAMPEKVGHDRRGGPVFQMTPDGEVLVDDNGLPTVDDHLPMVAKTFSEWIKMTGFVR